jgi:hypothetical protein
MKRLAVLAAALLVAAGPGDDWNRRKCCDGKVPRPWPKYNKEGVRWTFPMDAAVERARDSRKLLLVFHLVGDMDKEGC